MATTPSIRVTENTTQLMISESAALPRLEVRPLVTSPASPIKEFPQIMIEFKERYPIEPEARIEKNAASVPRPVGKSIVPDVDYAKPMLGTLTFLLQAFQQTCKVREDVKGGIEKLKKNFGLAEDYIAMYSANRKVVGAVNTLYITILKAIEDVIGYYTQHMFIKGLKAMWDGKNYEKSLLECLENISKDGNELIHEADTAHKQATNKVAEDLERGMFKGLGTMDTIDKRTENIEVMVKGANKGIMGMVKDHLVAMEARYEKERARHEKEKARNERDMQFLQRQIGQQNAENRDLKQLFYRVITPEPMPLAAPTVVTQQDLLGFLDSTDVDTSDIEYIIAQRELIIAGGQDRTEQIMKSPQLREWLVQAESKELLIHGNSEPEPLSPISFFCALLMQNLRGVDQFKSLAFFCGLHSYDDFGGARPMILSLLAQLLQQQQFDLGFVDHELAYCMDDGDIGAFCYVFGQLVRQVKSTESVFCVIDGINVYEALEEELLQDTACVLRPLLDLTRERGSVFKILVTSPSITEDTRQAIEDENYLALPKPAANTLGYSDLRFERQWQEGFKPNQHYQ
ncbi:uncharacterized protein PG986_013805 [Apiospora aurea]|uniref:Uncharacterized protein n=1 Tax=Apiospora aurea TaxID=335848 RepID=A0ABR1PWK3_9PEZI